MFNLYEQLTDALPVEAHQYCIDFEAHDAKKQPEWPQASNGMKSFRLVTTSRPCLRLLLNWGLAMAVEA